MIDLLLSTGIGLLIAYIFAEEYFYEHEQIRLIFSCIFLGIFLEVLKTYIPINFLSLFIHYLALIVFLTFPLFLLLLYLKKIFK